MGVMLPPPFLLRSFLLKMLLVLVLVLLLLLLLLLLVLLVLMLLLVLLVVLLLLLLLLLLQMRVIVQIRWVFPSISIVCLFIEPLPRARPLSWRLAVLYVCLAPPSIGAAITFVALALPLKA
jgi:hypothetical protein